MKTLFVKPPSRKFPGQLPAIEPPYWAMLMAQEAREHKDVGIIDASQLTTMEAVDKVNEANPDEVVIVVMGHNPSVSSTPLMKEAEWLVTALKVYEHNIKITGLHPMALKQTTEATTGCEVLMWKPPLNLSPAYDLINVNDYRAHNWHCLGEETRSPYGVIATSYGCPFACGYCNIHTLYQKHFEVRPIGTIRKELKVLSDRGVRHLKFWDELFAFQSKRVLDVCELLKDYDFNIWAYARPDTVNPETLKAMKAGGINWLAYGFDDKCKTRDIEKCIALTHDAGINIIGNFMHVDESDDVGRYAKFLPIEWANFYVAKPYPGSKWYEEHPVTDWEDFDQYGKYNAARDRAFQAFFSDAKYQERIGKRFGAKAVEQVKEMLSHDLVKGV